MATTKKVGIIFLITFIVSLISIWHYRHAQVDDAFITYRYARNLAAGHGFSYNPPEIVFGTTTPLYTVILSLAARFNLEIPLVSLFFNAAGLASLATVLYLLVKRETAPWFAAIFAALILLLPGSTMALGMETIVYTAVVYLALLYYGMKKYRTSTIICAIATLIRYDGILIGIVNLFSEWVDKKKIPWKNGTLFTGLIIPWLAYAYLTFGRITPTTFSAKTELLTLPNNFIKEFPDMFWGLFAHRTFDSVPSIITAFLWIMVLFGMVYSFRSSESRNLPIWVLFYTISFGLLGLRYTHQWYYYPIVPGVLIFTAYSLNWISNWLLGLQIKSKINLPWLLRTATLVISFALLAIPVLSGSLYFWSAASEAVNFGGRYKIYTLSASWICANASSNSSIAVPEIGIIGWTCPLKIIDPYGLVTPEMIPYVSSNSTSYGISKMNPDFIVLQHILLSSPETSNHLTESYFADYELRKSFQLNNYPYKVLVYSKTNR